MTFFDALETTLSPVTRGEPRYQGISTTFLPYYMRRFAPGKVTLHPLEESLEQRALRNRFMRV